MDRVTVAEAARILNISQDAVRKRIQRNTIAWNKDDEGRIFVYLSAPDIVQDGVQEAYISTLRSQVDELRDQVSFLRAELMARNEELRRKDHILAALTERIPELEAPRESRESRAAASEEEGKGEPPQQERRSWWQSIFGV